IAAQVELAELLRAHPPAGPHAVGEAECPASLEADSCCYVPDMANRIRAVVGDRVLLGVIRPDGVVLDVPDLVPQAPQTDQPVQIEPRLAAEGRATHHPEH